MVQEVLQSRQQPWRWVQWPAIRSWWRQLRGSSKLILLTTTWEVASFGIWSKVAKWKSSIRGAFMSWPQIKKKLLWSVLFSHSMQRRQIIFRSDWEVHWKAYFIWQQEVTSSVAASSKNSKALPKAKPAPKKGYGHCLVVCCWSDPLQLSEPWQNHYIWEVCSAHDEMHWKLKHLQPVLVNRKHPILHDNARPHVTQLRPQKLNEFGYQVLPHPPYLSDLSPTDYHFFKHLDNFLQGKRFHNQ